MQLTTTTRTRATPYARRLARERRLDLAAVTGSGPNGRITSIDLERLAAPAVPPAPAAAPPPAPLAAAPAPQPMPEPARLRQVEALGFSVELLAASELLGRIGAHAPAVGLVDLVIKAAGIAWAGAAKPGGLSLGGRTLPDPRRLTLGAIAAARAGTEQPDGAPGLAIGWVERAGLRPVAASLPVGAVAALTVLAVPAGATAECLLTHDTDLLDGDRAAGLALAFKALLEDPLALLI